MKGQGEDRTAAWLKNNLRTAERQAVVRLRLDPKRAAAGNKSPDFIIEMEVRLPLFNGEVVVVRAPVMVEVEALAGFGGALQDLERFVERSNDGSKRQPPAIELPFVCVTESGDHRAEKICSLPVRFVASEARIPPPPMTRDDELES